MAGASKLGGIFSAVVGIPATFWRKIPACEDGGCPGSKALGVLVDGRSQLGENGLHPGAIVRSNCLSTEFPDAVTVQVPACLVLDKSGRISHATVDDCENWATNCKHRWPC